MTDNEKLAIMVETMIIPVKFADSRDFQLVLAGALVSAILSLIDDEGKLIVLENLEDFF